MEQQASEHAAFTLMKEASNGSEISNRYNSLTIDEQRQVFTEMKNLQSDPNTMTMFGNIELIDANNDGRMDDAKSVAGNRRLDVYNPVGQEKSNHSSATKTDAPGTSENNHDTWPAYENSQLDKQQSQESAPFKQLTRQDIARDPYLRQAESVLRRASHGQDVHTSVEKFGNDPRMLEALKAVQSNSPEFQNVKLIDENGDGVLDDMRSTANGRDVDVYKTQQDRVAERVERTRDNSLRRGGEIVVDEVFRGVRQGSHGRGPSTTDRIQDRVSREGVNGAQRILRDVLRGN